LAGIEPDPLSKQLARERGYAVRENLGMHDQALLDARIFARLKEGWDWDNVKRLHVYLPLARRREIGTWALVRWLWAAHPAIRVYVPRLTSSGMDHVEINHHTQFRPNHYQVPEPMAGEMLGTSERLDMVITPLLAFDKSGHRVGYGGGYYDRFLAEHTAAERVGLAYHACLVPEGIAAEPHDVPMEVIVTENEVLRTSG
jgi:5-formyltetrahydrofolate cyclo-ligase